jgi:hypothetical protein
VNSYDIVELSGKQLEKMTDEELLAYFKEQLPETRPNLVRERKAKQQAASAPIVLQPSKQLALKALEEAGIDMSFLDRARRKRR